MQLLLLLVIFRNIYGLIYEKKENWKISAESVIHVEYDVPSELTCLHICLRLNSEALYTKTRCQCFGKMDITSNDAPLITGTCMQTKKTANDKRLDKEFGPIKLKEAQEIAAISKIKKTFHIQATFKIDHSELMTNTWYNLLLVTIGGRGATPGDRNPGIFLFKEYDYVILQISWPYRDVKPKFQQPFFDSSFKVDYIQEETSNGYLTRILINDSEVAKHTNANPQEFENLMVYASDPWHPVLKGSTAYVRFIKGVELKWQYDV